jgi:hypothetical protein
MFLACSNQKKNKDETRVDAEGFPVFGEGNAVSVVPCTKKTRTDNVAAGPCALELNRAKSNPTKQKVNKRPAGANLEDKIFALKITGQ